MVAKLGVLPRATAPYAALGNFVQLAPFIRLHVFQAHTVVHLASIHAPNAILAHFRLIQPALGVRTAQWDSYASGAAAHHSLVRAAHLQTQLCWLLLDTSQVSQAIVFHAEQERTAHLAPLTKYHARLAHSTQSPNVSKHACRVQLESSRTSKGQLAAILVMVATVPLAQCAHTAARSLLGWTTPRSLKQEQIAAPAAFASVGTTTMHKRTAALYVCRALLAPIVTMTHFFL